MIIMGIDTASGEGDRTAVALFETQDDGSLKLLALGEPSPRYEVMLPRAAEILVVR